MYLLSKIEDSSQSPAFALSNTVIATATNVRPPATKFVVLTRTHCATHIIGTVNMPYMNTL